MNVSEKDSRRLIVELFMGTSSLMERSDESFEVLRENVTSKKGMTFEALNVFEESQLDKIVNRALSKAYQRAVEMREL